MESTPGVCVNFEACDLAKLGRPIFVPLDDPFECLRCGARLRAPAASRGWRAAAIGAATCVAVIAAFATVAALRGGGPAVPAAKVFTRVSTTGGVVPVPGAGGIQGSASGQKMAAPADTLVAAGPVAAQQLQTAPAVRARDRPFTAIPVRGGQPPYPVALAADGRPGDVTARCIITGTGRPAACTVRAGRGGAAFVPPVLAWLRSGKVVYAPITHDGRVVQETHRWQIPVNESAAARRTARMAARPVPANATRFTGLAIDSSRPEFPDEFAAEDRMGAVRVDCLIGTQGHATDCRTSRQSGTARFAEAVTDWLRNPRTRFQPAVRNGQKVAVRRVWTVEFMP